jgi:alpha-ketoglutarate-dependent dioxygenase alkB family protein 2
LFCFVRALQAGLNKVEPGQLKWKKVSAEDLDLDYTNLLPPSLANQLLRHLESELEYFSGDLARVHVYGKWHPIPRQQVQWFFLYTE